MNRGTRGALAALLMCGVLACGTKSSDDDDDDDMPNNLGSSGSGGSVGNPGTGGGGVAVGSGGAGTTGAGGSGSGGKGVAPVAGSGGTTPMMVTDGGPAGPEDLTCPVVVSDNDCDKSKLPLVFVHGTYGSGDNIANVAQLFGSNGYCQDRFVAIEYDSLGGSPMAGLDGLVDKVRMAAGTEQVVLLGHSQGTGHCVTYLQDAAHAAKVANYINLSGTGMVPNNVKTLSLSSNNDISGQPHHAPNAEKAVTFEEADHFAVAAGTEAFIAIWEYLYGAPPQYTTIQCGEEEILLEGINETFADNNPAIDGTFEIYEIGENPRENGAPIMTLSAAADGHIGPIALRRGVAYEFKGVDPMGGTIGRMYFAPFKRSNRLARFLVPSENPLVVLTTTGNVITGPNHVAMVLRTLGGAFRQDLGNSLKLNGVEVLTAENAPRTNPTVGLFMSDQNSDSMSQLGVSFSAPFIVGTDVFSDAMTPAFLELTWFDGVATTTMKIPNWPSSDGMLSITLP